MKITAPGDQRFVDEYLERGMREFDTNRLATQLIRRLAGEFPDEFTSSALRMLDSNDESPALRLLTTVLLRQPTLFNELANPSLRSTARAVRLLRRFLRIDPSFDVQFARHLPDRTGANHSTAFGSVQSERALDVLDETSRGRRLLPILGHLLNSENPRISARAVLFVGRRVMSPAWVEKQLQRPDPRARANAIQGIWGLNSPAAVNLLEGCANDQCNRVVGNALVGLNIAGRQGVVEEIGRLSLRPQDAFRSTAAWTMGKIGDPAFLDPLQRLLRDDSPLVRGTALRAMIGIRQIEAIIAAEAQPKKPMDASPETVAESLAKAAEVIETLTAPKRDLQLDGSSFRYTRDNIAQPSHT